MSSVPDLSVLTDEKRLAAAARIQVAKDIQLPELSAWNYSPCSKHNEITPGCQQCGILHRKHQRIGATWLYFVKKGLIADQVGPQPLDAQVLTPTGYVNMGDLVVGDAVIDPEGHPSQVVNVYPRGIQDVYRITFSDGTWVESTLNHLWPVYLTGASQEWGCKVTATLESVQHLVWAGDLVCIPCIDPSDIGKPFLEFTNYKQIHSIWRSCTVPVQCIEVSAPSHLYITDNFTVTHNTGKTVIGSTLLAMMKEVGELENSRVLVVCRAPALMQWHTELLRMIPGLEAQVAGGTRPQRIEKYLQPWEVLVMGQQMLLRDMDMLQRNFQIRTLIVDDIDALRHRDNQTAKALKKIARDCDRVALLTGTPLQKRLLELWSVLEPIGGYGVFGSEEKFKRRYIRADKVTLYSANDRNQIVSTAISYQHMREFIQKIQPMALRRTAADIDDVTLPAVIPNNEFLELHPLQRDKYNELKTGIIRIVKQDGVKVKRATAFAALHYGSQICGGLAALGEQDGPGTSVKLDWLEEKIVDGDFSEEKVVVFINFKNTIRAFQERLRKAGVGFVTIWGEDKDKASREQSRLRFWNDSRCRVLMGTTSIEQSINLQIARHLVNVDQILNAARMVQLSGRVRRDGSRYSTVYVHNLLTIGTQEERYLPLLEREAALQNAVWQEESDLYAPLSSIEMMALITG